MYLQLLVSSLGGFPALLGSHVNILPSVFLHLLGYSKYTAASCASMVGSLHRFNSYYFIDSKALMDFRDHLVASNLYSTD